MAYNITEGWYKVWYDIGIDGESYPHEYSAICPLFISDHEFETGQGQIVSDGGVITDFGLEVLANTNISGLINNFDLGLRFNSSLSDEDIDFLKNGIINNFGVANLSFSLASAEQFIINADVVYYKAYLDEERTRLLYEGFVKKDSWQGYGEIFARCWLNSNTYQVVLPAFQANTSLNTLYLHSISAYNRGNIRCRFDAGNDDISSLLPLFDGLEPYVEDTDPYSKGGDTETGGGTGDFDGTSDDIPIPDLPTLSATSTNFITLFNPSLGELQNLANYMWSDLFDLDTFKKIFADPMDCILGLSIVPVAVPSGGSKAVTVGNISTGVTMQVASAQYVSVDCGTLNVNEYWGAYLDYDPYTKAEIYLPYIGTHPIAVDDIMGKAVHVVYHVDILSGACTAYVQCGGSVLYSFIGQCSASIPITGNDWTNVINGVLSIAGSIGSMVATGGMSAPLAVTAGASLASTAINSMKPSVEKSGSMSGVGGMLAVQTPYIILTRPRQARPKQQNTYTGYPSFITSKLSKLKGYTEIEVIHMDGLSCTDSEAVEIENLLKGGVIL